MKALIKAAALLLVILIFAAAFMGCRKQYLSNLNDARLEKTLSDLGVFVPGLGSASEIGIKEMRSIVEELEKDPERVWEYETIGQQYCYEQLRRAVKLYYADDPIWES